MFILQDGKLYVQEKKGLIGVSIDSDKILKIKGTEIALGKEHEKLSALEVRCRFNIRFQPYVFPVEKKVEKKEVVANATTTTKKVSGKSK